MIRVLLSASVVVGVGSAVFGCWMIYAPLGWIVGGLSLVGLSALLWGEIR